MTIRGLILILLAGVLAAASGLVFWRCEREAPLVSHSGGCALRITEREVNEAMSLSVALKRPDRRLGAIIVSRDSSFTEGSARV